MKPKIAILFSALFATISTSDVLDELYNAHLIRTLPANQQTQGAGNEPSFVTPNHVPFDITKAIVREKVTFQGPGMPGVYTKKTEYIVEEKPELYDTIASSNITNTTNTSRAPKQFFKAYTTEFIHAVPEKGTRIDQFSNLPQHLSEPGFENGGWRFMSDSDQMSYVPNLYIDYPGSYLPLSSIISQARPNSWEAQIMRAESPRSTTPIPKAVSVSKPNTTPRPIPTKSESVESTKAVMTEKAKGKMVDYSRYLTAEELASGKTMASPSLSWRMKFPPPPPNSSPLYNPNAKFPSLKRLLFATKQDSVQVKDPVNPKLSFGDSYENWSKKNDDLLEGYSGLRDDVYEDVCEDAMRYWITKGQCPVHDERWKHDWRSPAAAERRMFDKNRHFCQADTFFESLNYFTFRLLHICEPYITWVLRVNDLPNIEWTLPIFGLQMEALPIVQATKGRIYQLFWLIGHVWSKYILTLPRKFTEFLHGLIDELAARSPHEALYSVYVAVFGPTCWGFVAFLIAYWHYAAMIRRAIDIREQRGWNQEIHSAIDKLVQRIEQVNDNLKVESRRVLAYVEDGIKQIKEQDEKNENQLDQADAQDPSKRVVLPPPSHRDIKMGRYVAQYVGSTMYFYFEHMKKYFEARFGIPTDFPMPQLFGALPETNHLFVPPRLDRNYVETFENCASHLGIPMNYGEMEYIREKYNSINDEHIVSENAPPFGGSAPPSSTDPIPVPTLPKSPSSLPPSNMIGSNSKPQRSSSPTKKSSPNMQANSQAHLLQMPQPQMSNFSAYPPPIQAHYYPPKQQHQPSMAPPPGVMEQVQMSPRVEVAEQVSGGGEVLGFLLTASPTPPYDASNAPSQSQRQPPKSQQHIGHPPFGVVPQMQQASHYSSDFEAGGRRQSPREEGSVTMNDSQMMREPMDYGYQQQQTPTAASSEAIPTGNVDPQEIYLEIRKMFKFMGNIYDSISGVASSVQELVDRADILLFCSNENSFRLSLIDEVMSSFFRDAMKHLLGTGISSHDSPFGERLKNWWLAADSCSRALSRAFLGEAAYYSISEYLHYLSKDHRAVRDIFYKNLQIGKILADEGKCADALFKWTEKLYGFKAESLNASTPCRSRSREALSSSDSQHDGPQPDMDETASQIHHQLQATSYDGEQDSSIQNLPSRPPSTSFVQCDANQDHMQRQTSDNPESPIGRELAPFIPIRGRRGSEEKKFRRPSPPVEPSPPASSSNGQYFGMMASPPLRFNSVEHLPSVSMTSLPPSAAATVHSVPPPPPPPPPPAMMSPHQFPMMRQNELGFVPPPHTVYQGVVYPTYCPPVPTPPPPPPPPMYSLAGENAVSNEPPQQFESTSMREGEPVLDESRESKLSNKHQEMMMMSSSVQESESVNQYAMDPSMYDTVPHTGMLFEEGMDV